MTPSWHPPTDSLLRSVKGLWIAPSNEPVSYPEDGNEACFQIEDTSYWFAHRNRCLIELLRRFPPGGPFFDIGGGNGFVSAGLEAAGFETVLVEPGPGAKNALQRGLTRVIQGTLESCQFPAASLSSLGAFDVVEHIEDDAKFLATIHRHLRKGGRFYVTVPAIPMLWSMEDVHAGHYRRYTRKTLSEILERAGFEIEYTSSLFSWLVIPVFLFRALPWCWKGSKRATAPDLTAAAADHSLPDWISGIVRKIHQTEQKRVRRLRLIPFGTSLICVARKR